MNESNFSQPTEPLISAPPPQRWWQTERWRWAAGCFLLGVAYTGLALAFGFELKIAGRDISMLAGAALELSFAVLGYLLGLTSEARRGERRAAQDNDQRLRQVADLQARLAQKEKLASLGQLAGAVAHEVRNPLAIVRSMVQNLREELPDHSEDPRQACDDILEEVDRLARVTSQLVDFARPLNIQRTELAMSELSSRVQLLAAAWLKDTNLHLETRGPEGVQVLGDPDLLCQVLLGLVSNAAQASPAQGRITLAWSAVDNDVHITVTDQGEGVPSELHDQIFEPFFTTRPEGHGLGLAVARQMIEAQGGRISVADPGPSSPPESSSPSDPLTEPESRGASFQIQLPMAHTP